MATVMAQLAEARAVWAACDALAASLEPVCHLAVDTLGAGRCWFACGNGGSAADALHLVEELVGKYSKPRRPLPAICLGGDAASLTCIANDYGFEHVFARPLEALARPGDVLAAFTTSGRSPNVVAALRAARQREVQTVLFTGAAGGPACEWADHAIRVPSDNTARIQEVHTFCLHAILEAVDAAFA